MRSPESESVGQLLPLLGSGGEGMVRCVREELADAEERPSEIELVVELVLELRLERFSLKEADAEAAAEVKDESKLGNCVSGAIVLSIVSHASSSAGLKLRSRSPSPFILPDVVAAAVWVTELSIKSGRENA